MTMKPNPEHSPRGLLSRVLAIVSLAVALLPCLADAQTTDGSGSIFGQISNTATGANLQGVRVQVAGTTHEAVTDNEGRYEIRGLPPGTYTVTADYPGLDRNEGLVAVGANERVRRDVGMGSGVYVLEKFTVASEREGNAAAIAAQRNAVNVQNIVTSDAFGSIAKGNVANFLRRIPGIAGTTDEIDTENVILRGMAANFTTLDIDGSRYAAGGTGRSQSALGVPTDMIERVEVIKAPTPDTESDSLGGRINMVTRSAFDRQGRRISARIGNSYSLTYGDDVGHRRSSALSPTVGVSYADTFSVNGEKNNLGVLFSANWERFLDVRGTTSWDSFVTMNGVDYPRFNNVSVALHGVDRGGVNLRFDYKINSQFSVGTSLQFNTNTNNMFRSRNRIAGGTVRPNLSASDFSFTVIDGANYGTERSDRDRFQNRTAARLYGKYQRPGGLRVDVDFSAQRNRLKEYTEFFTANSALRMNYVLERREGYGDSRWPTIGMLTNFYPGNSTTTTTVPTPAQYLPINPFSDDFRSTGSATGLQWQQLYAKNEIVRSKIDVTKKFEWGIPVELKTGLSHRLESVKSSRDDLRGSINLATTGYGPDLRPLLDTEWNLGGAIGRYPVGYVIDIEKVTAAMGIRYLGNNPDPAQAWDYNRQLFTIDTNGTRQNTLQNGRQIWEHIYGTYLQGNVKLGKLDVVTGVRVEHAKNIRNQVRRNRRASGTLAEWTDRIYNDAQQTNYYPSAHAKYSFSKNLIARGSYSTTSGRPNWGQIMGVADANDTNYTINVPNLELKPRESTNYDLSLEYYFEPVGVLSVGLFRKEIENYDVQFERFISADEARDLGAQPAPGDDTPYRMTTRLNAGFGEVNGVELSYSQQLSFLPGFARGFGVFANYTYLKTEGTFDNAGAAGLPPQVTRQLEGFIPRTANAGLSFVYNRYDLRASWNFTDDWPESTNSDPATNKIRGSRWTIDFSGKYRLTRQFTVFCDLVNVTSNHGKKYRGWHDRLRQNETNALGFLMTAGLMANF